MKKPDELILSRQNPLIMLTASLSDRKYREKTGLFRFDGKKLLIEAIQADLPLFALLFRESTAQSLLADLPEKALPPDCRAVCLSDVLFDRISEEKSPEGVICLSHYLDKIQKIITIDKKELLEEYLCPGGALILESIRDPGNLGTAIRSARAFGIGNLILSADCADIYHPRTVRAAMGTLFSQPIVVTPDLPGAVRALKKRGNVYAAALDEHAKRLGTFLPGREDSVVVGNEGHGLSSDVLCACSGSVFIPMAPGVESLNAGVAASVLLWEFYRGR